MTFDPVLDSEICFLAELPFVAADGAGRVTRWVPAHSRTFVLVENPGRSGIALTLDGMEFSGGHFRVEDLDEGAFLSARSMTFACHVRVGERQFEYPVCLFSKGNHETSHAYFDLFQGAFRFKFGDGPRHSIDVSKFCPGELYIVASAADKNVNVLVNGKFHGFPESYEAIGAMPAPYCIGARYEDGEGRALLRGCSISRLLLYSSVVSRDDIEAVHTFLAA